MEKARKLSRRMEFQGLNISIETDKGEIREWFDTNSGQSGKTTMVYPYGYITGLKEKGEDGDCLDCFVGPNKDAEVVYVVRQLKKPEFKEFDEEKVMFGFETEKEAKQAYLEHYDDKRFFGSIYSMPIDEFKSELVKSMGNQLPMDQMKPQFTYDIDQLPNVEHWLNSVGSLKEKDILGLCAEIWGPGYSFIKLSKTHIIAELRGFLRDQQELLLLAQPDVVESSVDPVAVPHAEQPNN
jgi:hypothetical protein